MLCTGMPNFYVLQSVVLHVVYLRLQLPRTPKVSDNRAYKGIIAGYMGIYCHICIRIEYRDFSILAGKLAT